MEFIFNNINIIIIINPSFKKKTYHHTYIIHTQPQQTEEPITAITMDHSHHRKEENQQTEIAKQKFRNVTHRQQALPSFATDATNSLA